MAGERLVAVSYPADAEYVRVNTELLAGEAEVAYTYELDAEERVATLRRADALLAWNLAREVPAGALAGADRLRFVQVLSAGVDALDFSALPPGLLLASNAGAYAGPMSEHILAMTLSLAKRLPQRHAALASGRFEKWAPSLVLDGAVCVILGFGGIGKATARVMTALGARIHAINRDGRTDEPVEWAGTLADLYPALERADVLVVSLPLTLATRGLIGGRELALMKPTTILVNVARGPIIDQGALYEHLRTHPEFSAGIDTWWEEPSGGGPFRTEFPFFDLPNVLGSPHNSSIVPGTMLSAARLAAQNMRHHLRGEPISGVIRREEYVAEQEH